MSVEATRVGVARNDPEHEGIPRTKRSFRVCCLDQRKTMPVPTVWANNRDCGYLANMCGQVAISSSC